MRLLTTGLLALMLTACASALRWEGGSARDGHYEVRSGDTLYSIALRHDVDYRDLARWNGISRNYLIRPGQQLRLSPPASQPTPTRTASNRSSPDRESQPSDSDRSDSSRTSTPAPAPVERDVGAWQWPVTGDILRGFKLPDSKGVDIAAAEGTKVRAVAPGRVVYSGSALKGYGELIIVKHNETYLSAYGYNRRRLAEEGDEVDAGQTIAEVGTGPAQRSMLHFEIRRAGKPVDPLRLLPADG